MSAKSQFRQAVLEKIANLARLQGALTAGLSPGPVSSPQKPAISTGASMGPASTSGAPSFSKMAYRQVVSELEWEKTAAILLDGEIAASLLLQAVGC